MRNLLLLASITFLISCGHTNSQIIENIEAPQFQKLINKETGIIIDVRTPQEFHSGHIEDATNIDFYASDFTDKLKIVRKDGPIYVYCRSGGRSSSAASKMKKLMDQYQICAVNTFFPVGSTWFDGIGGSSRIDFIWMAAEKLPSVSSCNLLEAKGHLLQMAHMDAMHDHRPLQVSIEHII